MENSYDKVVKLTAEILKKSWKPEPGKVTPFSSSSSMHSEQSDNHLEYYVQQGSTTPLGDAIANIFNSNFWTNGGDKMTDKNLDVDSSTTPEQQYNNPGSSTTEPDPQSEIAITKSMDKLDIPQGANDEEGKGTYSTTANTTTQAPAAGDTTEPTVKAADADTDNDSSSEPDADADDAKAKAAKQAKKLKKAQKLVKKYKKAKKLVKEAKKAEMLQKQSEQPADASIQKSATPVETSTWKGAFSPQIKRGM